MAKRGQKLIKQEEPLFHQIKEIEVTDGMRNRASILANDLGELRNSITGGAGNIIGFIGETLLGQYLGIEPVHSYDYDFVLPDGRTVDVKTKATTVMPKADYDCSVAAYNTKQKCDIYLFCRVLNNLSKGWILGWVPREEFYERAERLNKGFLDKSNGFRVKANCYNIKINELYDVEKLKNNC